MADYSILFLCVSAFAVFFVALAKAGFGGILGSLAMPLVAAFSDITTAIGVLLPAFIAIDLVVVWLYRKDVPIKLLWPMALSGVVGVAIAGLAFRFIDASYLALFLGVMSLVLGAGFFLKKTEPVPIQHDPYKRDWPRLVGWNSASGFTSFFLMGGPPIQMYLLPLRLPPKVYVSLLVWFFFIVNWSKMPIVLSMGVVTWDTLWVSALLLPILPLGIAIGKYLNSRIPKEPFYRIVHILLCILGLYLIATAFA